MQEQNTMLPSGATIPNLDLPDSSWQSLMQALILSSQDSAEAFIRGQGFIFKGPILYRLTVARSGQDYTFAVEHANYSLQEDGKSLNGPTYSEKYHVTNFSREQLQRHLQEHDFGGLMWQPIENEEKTSE